MALHLLSNYYCFPYNFNNNVNNSRSGSFSKFHLRFPSSGTPHSAGFCSRQSERPTFIISSSSSCSHSQTPTALLSFSSSSSSSLFSSHCNALNSTVSEKVFTRNRSSTRGGFVPRSHMTTERERPVQEGRMLVFVPPHPLIKHWVSVLRNEQTPCPIFKNAMAELGRLLMYEASRDCLMTVTGEIQSPMGVAAVEFIDPREPVAVVPILRAGLALAEYASSVLPASKTYHLGVSRNEETLLPTVYLNKLPESFPEGSQIFVVDPMLATGGTIVAAIDLLKERGADNKQIKVIAAVAAPPALQKLSEKFPGLHVYAGMIDPTVNDKGFIIPGLGDAGDRSFGT